MQVKRKSIANEIMVVISLISVLSVLIISAVGLGAMTNIREKSQDALIEQMKQNLNTSVIAKMEIAGLQLSKYVDHVETYAKIFEEMYQHKDQYVPRIVDKPDTTIVDTYTLQRNLLNENKNLDEVKDEMYLLANIEKSWIPLMEREGDVITSVYAGTENGFMLSYDKFVNYAEPAPDGEVYFNHLERPWYIKAKEEGKTIFTDLEQDSFGKGLTLTCATPFYKDGVIAGVVAIDILVSDLQSSIIDIDMGEGAYAFIIDHNGDIVASPFVKNDTVTFENIKNEDNEYNEIKDNIFNKESGVVLLKNGVYCAYHPVSIIGWTFCIHIPESLVLQPVNNMNNLIRMVILWFVIIFVIIMIFSLILARNFARKLATPIVLLKKDVDVISSGDFDKKVSVEANDEIGDLAHAFNNMTASLKKYIQDLTEVTAEKERIGAELNVATQIQASMLPTDFENYASDKRFSIFASMTPAKEVGGDFYDFFMIDDKHMAIVVADVSGKGVPAALFMVIGKTLIKDHSMSNRDLGEIFAEVNNLLCEANSEELFITAFEAVINLETGKVRYVNAGHEMPYIYRKGKEWNAFEMKAAFVLAGMEGMKYKAGEFDIEPGDKIFQYTDGVTEATNVNNELYGMDRLKKVLDANVDIKPAELLPVVKADIDKFVGEAPQFDDITMLGFEYLSNTKD